MDKKYRSFVTFPQGIIQSHYDRGNGILSSTLSSDIILVSNDFRKIKSRAYQIAEKYNAGWIEIFNMDTKECVFFVANRELDEICPDKENFDEKAAWDYFGKYSKVVIKPGKLGYVENSVLDLDK